MNTKEMEYALFQHFLGSMELITTGITGGYDIVGHECDILMVNKNRFLTEIEIKVSKSDLKADFKKKHNHDSKQIKYTYFAIPKEMEDCLELIPNEFGVIIVRKSTWTDKYMKKVPIIKTCYPVKVIRRPKKKSNHKINDINLLKLYRLASMRYWKCKENELKNEGLIIHKKLNGGSKNEKKEN